MLAQALGPWEIRRPNEAARVDSTGPLLGSVDRGGTPPPLVDRNRWQAGTGENKDVHAPERPQGPSSGRGGPRSEVAQERLTVLGGTPPSQTGSQGPRHPG